jgi:thiol-disulfide isomerase/thioredoxin
MKKFIVILLLSLQSLAVVNTKAPEIQASDWINSDPISITDLKGKVVIIDFFQLWCPGCNSFTKPLLKYWHKKYDQQLKSGDLVIMGVHTVFEGHSIQTIDALKLYLQENNITHPIANDLLISGHLPETMKAYRTSGTPEVAIIDKQGIIRFQKFGFFNTKAAEKLIDKLLKQ